MFNLSVSRPAGEHWEMFIRANQGFLVTDKDKMLNRGALFLAQTGRSRSRGKDTANLQALRSQWVPPYKASMESSFLSRVDMRAALVPNSAAN
jgi:hypothetical protein